MLVDNKVKFANMLPKEISSMFWIIGLLAALAATLLFSYLWFKWTFFAMAITAFYIFGSFSLMPMRKSWHIALNSGIFLGQLIALGIWVGHL